MFPESWIESEFLNKFYIMDVVLNRAPSPATMGDPPDNATMGDPSDNDDGKCRGVNPDVVRLFRSYEPEDILPGKDYCYWAAVLFLPQCGKFYCHRECCRGDVGVPGTFIAHDMSWLRLQRTETHGSREVSYLFGADSFVKRFFLSLRAMVCVMKMAVLVGNTLTRTVACLRGGSLPGERAVPSRTV